MRVPNCREGILSYFLCSQAFFAEHPEYANNDFYITGESYAGHYIPAFASRVHQGNKAKEGIHINLKVHFSPFLIYSLNYDFGYIFWT